ncbi:uncharacterized protein TNCV_403251 [Trichonephila clavipes]|nr:uncharacterized protein TNCV_403251 [Trichonephila clavipes]
MEKLRPNQIDKVISAEIPNPETDRKLYDTVTNNMTQGPCGALNPSSPCMKEGKCTKKYPRVLLKDTQTNDKGCPLYRRRAPEDGGRTITQKTRGGMEDKRVGCQLRCRLRHLTVVQNYKIHVLSSRVA